MDMNFSRDLEQIMTDLKSVCEKHETEAFLCGVDKNGLCFGANFGKEKFIRVPEQVQSMVEPHRMTVRKRE